VVAAAAAVVALVAVVAVAQVVVLLVAGRPPGGDWVWWPSILAAALAAVAFEPVRRALVAAFDRSARRGPRTPETVIAGFGDRVSRGVPTDELLLELAEALRRGFAARRAEVWRLEGSALHRVASVPDGPPLVVEVPPTELAALARVGTAGEAWLGLWAPTLERARREDRPDVTVRLAPARHGGAVLGALVVERGAGDGPFDAHVDRAIGELGRRLGDLLRNRQLDQALGATLADLRVANADLRASRARLVSTADAERRRLERDLHDGAQQQLVTLALRLGLARDGLVDDPLGTRRMLDQLVADVRLAIDQLRDLAHGIYPPLLMDLGLAGALAAVGRRNAQPVTVEASGVSRAGPDIEAAAYFCCLEALQNVAKHAPLATVTIHVEDGTDGSLTFVVRDDGPGFVPATVPAGHGLQNMADRVGAVGGRLSVDSAPGRGTTVTGTLPR
jgi:signal transduction histidine kinase